MVGSGFQDKQAVDGGTEVYLDAPICSEDGYTPHNSRHGPILKPSHDVLAQLVSLTGNLENLWS